MTTQDIEQTKARLASAAPDMLIALKEAAEFIKRKSECWNSPGQTLLVRCQKAIAKAEGRNE